MVNASEGLCVAISVARERRVDPALPMSAPPALSLLPAHRRDAITTPIRRRPPVAARS